MIRSGRENCEFALENSLQGAAVRDVGRNLGGRHRGLQPVELLLRAVHHGHRIVAGAPQKFRDHRTDLAGTNHNDLFHFKASARDGYFPSPALRMVG